MERPKITLSRKQQEFPSKHLPRYQLHFSNAPSKSKSNIIYENRAQEKDNYIYLTETSPDRDWEHKKFGNKIPYQLKESEETSILSEAQAIKLADRLLISKAKRQVKIEIQRRTPILEDLTNISCKQNPKT